MPPIDGDLLAVLSSEDHSRPTVPSSVILTPHPRPFSRKGRRETEKRGIATTPMAYQERSSRARTAATLTPSVILTQPSSEVPMLTP